ncbi:MAG: hypothetical protein M1837_005429 [Sclerophora amabilis]|nr:MAG: hypothetical protein M1837_005429 [Sclerophora amabilis]
MVDPHYQPVYTEVPAPPYSESPSTSFASQANNPDYPEKPSSQSLLRSSDDISYSTLPSQLATSREQRIRALIDTYIQPVLSEHGLSGLYKTTCVFIPSNVTALQSTHSPNTVAAAPATSNDNSAVLIGFPSEDYVNPVRLRGAEHSLEFWRQPAVVAELRQELKAHLIAAGHRLVDDDPQPVQDTPTSTTQATPLSPQTSRGRSNFFRRKMGAASSSLTTSESQPQWQPILTGGWRATDSDTQSASSTQLKRLDAGEVRVDVGIHDVSMRFENDYGLYETRTGKALVLTIEVGN